LPGGQAHHPLSLVDNERRVLTWSVSGMSWLRRRTTDDEIHTRKQEEQIGHPLLNEEFCREV
jgi:hypothetical protein